MSIATLGAFAIGEYPEGVAVMLFYAVGELFQNAAVKRAKGNIKALLDVRPNEAVVYRNGDYVSVNPETVEIGEKIQVRVGEKIPLDGKLLSEKASVNTAAITGESKPDTIAKGDKVFAGSINLEGVIEVETTKGQFHCPYSRYGTKCYRKKIKDGTVYKEICTHLYSYRSFFSGMLNVFTLFFCGRLRVSGLVIPSLDFSGNFLSLCIGHFHSPRLFRWIGCRIP